MAGWLGKLGKLAAEDHRVRLGLGLAAALVVATPAVAGDAECMWKRLPEAARETVSDQGPVEANLQKWTPEFIAAFGAREVATAAAACGFKDLGAASWILTSRVFEEQARRWLAAKHGVSAERLEAAWMQTDRSALENGGLVSDGAISGIVQGVLGRLELAGDREAQGAVRTYLFGRWNREKLERLF